MRCSLCFEQLWYCVGSAVYALVVQLNSEGFMLLWWLRWRTCVACLLPPSLVWSWVLYVCMYVCVRELTLSHTCIDCVIDDIIKYKQYWFRRSCKSFLHYYVWNCCSSCLLLPDPVPRTSCSYDILQYNPLAKAALDFDMVRLLKLPRSILRVAVCKSNVCISMLLVRVLWWNQQPWYCMGAKGDILRAREDLSPRLQVASESSFVHDHCFGQEGCRKKCWDRCVNTCHGPNSSDVWIAVVISKLRWQFCIYAPGNWVWLEGSGRWNFISCVWNLYWCRYCFTLFITHQCKELLIVCIVYRRLGCTGGNFFVFATMSLSLLHGDE
jgi:hypothetical protein